jgi:hypothetical protein
MNILSLLESAETSDVIDALYALGSSGKDAVTSEVAEALTRLVDHQEADVREEVAAAAGIRLRLPSLYPLFVRRLQGVEECASVLAPLIDATVALSLHGAGNRKELSALLGQYVLDERQDDEVRGTAYLGLLKLWSKISAKEYAVAPRALSQMSWNRNLVVSLIQ